MSSRPPQSLAVLASGEGTNFEAIARAAASGVIPGRVAVLLSDRPGAPALERARRLGIEAVCPPVGRYRTRIEDERPWIEALATRGVEWVVMAGFMRRVHDDFLAAYRDRIVNIHPSLLPSFPGLDAIRRAWAHGVRVTGCTVHLVDGEVDGGAIVAQSAVDVRDGDTLETLEARIHDAEHRLYPVALRRLMSERWSRVGRRVVFAPEQTVGA